MARGPHRHGAQCSCIGCIGVRPALFALLCQILCANHAQAQKCLNIAFEINVKNFGCRENSRSNEKLPTGLDEALRQCIRLMFFAMRQNWWLQRYGVFVCIPSFALQKVACCRVPVVKQVVMKTQEKQRGEFNAIRRQSRP